jgi:hypothetical protein
MNDCHPRPVNGYWIDFSAGSAGYDVRTLSIVDAYASPGIVTLVGSYDSSFYHFNNSITVDLYGNPGPLNDDGSPASLDRLLGAGGDITVQPGYHEGIYFQGWFSGQVEVQAVPEPSSLLTTTACLGGIAAGYGARRMKKRPGPR